MRTLHIALIFSAVTTSAFPAQPVPTPYESAKLAFESARLPLRGHEDWFATLDDVISGRKKVWKQTHPITRWTREGEVESNHVFRAERIFDVESGNGDSRPRKYVGEINSFGDLSEYWISVAKKQQDQVDRWFESQAAAKMYRIGVTFRLTDREILTSTFVEGESGVVEIKCRIRKPRQGFLVTHCVETDAATGRFILDGYMNAWESDDVILHDNY